MHEKLNFFKKKLPAFTKKSVVTRASAGDYSVLPLCVGHTGMHFLLPLGHSRMLAKGFFLALRKGLGGCFWLI